MRLVPVLVLMLLALASFGFSEMAQQPPPASAHVWRQSQKTDSARGITYNRFTLTGKFAGEAPRDVPNRPAFVVDCAPDRRSPKGRFAAGEFLVGVPLKIDYVEPAEIHGTSYFPKVKVKYRLNDAKEEQVNWAPGSDKPVTSVLLTKEMLKKIIRARTVQITANDEHGSPVVTQFDMPDAKPVVEACNMDDSKK
jgi:hypothetical protein